jgi:hypothetical protein
MKNRAAHVEFLALSGVSIRMYGTTSPTNQQAPGQHMKQLMEQLMNQQAPGQHMKQLMKMQLMKQLMKDRAAHQAQGSLAKEAGLRQRVDSSERGLWTNIQLFRSACKNSSQRIA